MEKSALQNFMNSRTPVGSARSSLQLKDQRRTRSCVGFSTLNHYNKHQISIQQRTYSGCKRSQRSVLEVSHGFDGKQCPKKAS